MIYQAHPDDLVHRAMAAYKRHGAVIGATGGYCESFGGRLHVIVHKCGAAIAVYATRNDGRLRRVWKWPEAIW